MSSTSTLRNSRIIIASLFLPHTVVLGPPDLSDEHETSPADICSPAESEEASISVPEVVKRLEAASTLHPRSIVEDLKDRASRKPTPVAQTPSSEKANPFSKLSTPKGSPPVKIPAPIVPKPSLLSRPPPPSPSVSALKRTVSRQRSRTLRTRASRSSSRPGHVSSPSVASIASLASATSAVSVGSLDEEDEDVEFHVEPNLHCNGGLKNAIESVSAPPSPKDPRFVPRHNRSNSKQLHGDGRLKEKFWVGTLGTKTDTWDHDLRGRVSAHLREKDGSQVVWVEDAVFEGCYDEFCHQVLWPALHYAVPDAPRTKLFYESASYSQYVALNRAFAERIAEVWKEGDIVWVNDYHLMLLPHMLRSSGFIPSSAPIGFFLHVAFPSSEIFRCLSVRSHLLKGMLGADLVGFQTANYARHFRQTCTRVLGVEAVPRGVVVLDEQDEENGSTPSWSKSKEKDNTGSGSSSSSDDEHHALHGFPHRKSTAKMSTKLFATAGTLDGGGKGRFVDVGVFPMGIDVRQLMERKKDKEVGEWIEVLKARYKANGMKVIVGRDKLDEIQGVRQKIQAFELFLEKNPTWVGKVVLIQLALVSPAPPSTVSSHTISTTGEDTADMTSTILSAIAHVNSQFSTLTYQPVVFLHTQDVDFNQYLALLSVADAFLVTSLREGMALRTHEFVTCQLERGETKNAQPGEEGERKGVLILSEFTGSYSYSGFRSCIAINPWDARGTAEAINTALTMPRDEAHSRWEDLHSHVITQTAQAFVAGFLTRCVRANGEHVSRHRNGDLARTHSFLDEGVQELSVPKVLEKWKGASRRLILVDWEGSLVGDYVPAAAAGAFAAANAGVDVTSEGVAGRKRMKEDEFQDAVRVLKKLVQEEKNEVWLLSGLPVRGVLERVVNEVGEKIGVVAENGCFVKYRGASEGTGPNSWVTMVGNRNMTWKTSCLEILNYFTERTPGSFVEEREASVVWRFWTGPTDDSSDRQWARRQAAEAQNHIFDSIGERYALRIIPGTNSFLILPNNLSRSTAVGAILLPGGPASNPLGRAPTVSIDDDGVPATVADEWDCLLAVSGDEKLLRRLSELDNSETCSTSGKGTDAKWRVEREAVVPFLEELASV